MSHYLHTLDDSDLTIHLDNIMPVHTYVISLEHHLGEKKYLQLYISELKLAGTMFLKIKKFNKSLKYVYHKSLI